jgi:hypothetical protein
MWMDRNRRQSHGAMGIGSQRRKKQAAALCYLPTSLIREVLSFASPCCLNFRLPLPSFALPTVILSQLSTFLAQLTFRQVLLFVPLLSRITAFGVCKRWKQFSALPIWEELVTPHDARAFTQGMMCAILQAASGQVTTLDVGFYAGSDGSPQVLVDLCNDISYRSEDALSVAVLRQCQAGRLSQLSRICFRDNFSWMTADSIVTIARQATSLKHLSLKLPPSFEKKHLKRISSKSLSFLRLNIPRQSRLHPPYDDVLLKCPNLNSFEIVESFEETATDGFFSVAPLGSLRTLKINRTSTKNLIHQLGCVEHFHATDHKYEGSIQFANSPALKTLRISYTMWTVRPATEHALSPLVESLLHCSQLSYLRVDSSIMFSSPNASIAIEPDLLTHLLGLPRLWLVSLPDGFARVDEKLPSLWQSVGVVDCKCGPCGYAALLVKPSSPLCDAAHVHALLQRKAEGGGSFQLGAANAQCSTLELKWPANDQGGASREWQNRPETGSSAVGHRALYPWEVAEVHVPCACADCR